MVTRPVNWRAVRGALQVAAMLLGAYLAVRAAGGSSSAWPHAFYIPIVFAAVWSGWLGAIGSAFAAAILCGPLMPLEVAAGTPQSAANWLVRAGFFLAVAAVAATATDRARRTAEQERALADERVELATGRLTLLQIISHELRTPLTVIKGNLQLALDPRVDDRTRVPLIAAIERATGRLEDLAQIVGASVEPSAPTDTVETSVAALIDQAMASVSPAYGPERLRISTSTQRTIHTQPEALRLALRWLAENALKFSPDHEPVDVAAHDDPDTVVIQIRDRGPGIPDDFTTGQFPIMRQADSTTTREHGGLGLGLYATNRLVQRLGGHVTVERHDGGGTTATVTLAAPSDHTSNDPTA